MTPLQRCILQTLAYHALFEFPLTREEIYRGLISDRPFSEEEEVYEALDTLIPHHLSRVEGFITEKGSEHFVQLRKERYRLAEKKFRKAMCFVWWCRFLPFVRMMAVSNTLSTSNAREASDIDFFIIAQKGHLWTSRFFVTGLAEILHERPNLFERKDKLCLCFYYATGDLSLESIALPQDIYLPHWIAQLYPLYDAQQYYEHFWRTNSWIKRVLPHAQSIQPVPRRTVQANKVSRTMQKWAERFLGRFEPFFARLQEAKLPENLKNQRHIGTSVITSSALLKFHEDDKRAAINNAWEQRYHL